MAIIKALATSFRKISTQQSQSRLIFSHVPKCGGNSVVSSLISGSTQSRKFFKIDYLNTSICDQLSEGDVVKWLNFSADIFSYNCLNSSANLIVGHAPLYYSTRNLFDPDTKVITILRDPANRLISNYVFDRYKASGPGKHELSIESYLESDKGKVNGQYYARFFGSCSKEISQNALIKEAIINLSSFDIVGQTECMSQFLAELERITGFTLTPQNKNTSPRSEEAIKILSNPILMSRIKAICAVDYEIYNHFLL